TGKHSVRNAVGIDHPRATGWKDQLLLRPVLLKVRAFFQPVVQVEHVFVVARAICHRQAQHRGCVNQTAHKWAPEVRTDFLRLSQPWHERVKGLTYVPDAAGSGIDINKEAQDARAARGTSGKRIYV